MTKYCINIETGTVEYCTDATAAIPVLFREIDDDTAKAIFDKTATVAEVIEAVKKDELENSSWEDYDRRRQEARKMRNISIRNYEKLTMPEEQPVVSNAKVTKLADVLAIRPKVDNPETKSKAAERMLARHKEKVEVAE